MKTGGTKHGAPEEKPGTAFLTRLLIALALAFLVPLAVFAILGYRGLRSEMRATLVARLLEGLARETAERVAGRLRAGRRAAALLFGEPRLVAFLRGDAGAERSLETWVLHRNLDLAAAGRILVFDARGTWRFDLRAGEPRFPQERLPDWVPPAWRHPPSKPVFLPMCAAPGRPAPAGSTDPQGFVLPFVVPILSADQTETGVGVALLPAAALQTELDRTKRVLAEEIGVHAGGAALVAAGGRRFLLHTDRRLLSPAGGPARAGFVRADYPLGRVLGAPSLPWRVRIEAHEDEFLAAVDTLGRAFLWLVLGLSIAVFAAAGLASWALARPLKELAAATERLGAGDLEARAPVEGPRETRALARALNRMAAQLLADRRRREQAERDRAWTQMARQVAHEVKNPLQPIRLHAELVQRLASGLDREGAAGAASIARSADVILRQVARMQRIVADFQDFARAGEAPAARACAAAEVLDEIRCLHEAGGEVELVLRLPSDFAGVRVEADPLRLQQVLVNLVRNAIEADPHRPARVEIEARVDAGRLCLEVLDRGAGLPGDPQALFEPYVSTKAGGTGLGLAICKRQIEAMGGRIGLEARPGGGARAWIELPLAEEGV